MKAIILTEGGGKSGLGHICRSVSLCQAFKKRGVKVKLAVNAPSSLKLILKGTDHLFFDWIKHQDKALDILDGFDIAVIDSYLCSATFCKKISSVVGLVVFVDDNKRLDYASGAVCNGNIYAKELRYPRNKGLRYFLGPEFATLREEFWAAGGKRVRKNASSLLVTLGGSKAAGSLLKGIAASLKKSHPQVKITAVAGGSVEAGKMKQLMSETDIAVSGCGQTVYELARMGVPTIGIIMADNQYRNMRAWRRSGFLAYAGRAHDEGLKRALSLRLDMLCPYNTRKRVSRIGQRIVDGKGSLRIVDNILKMVRDRGPAKITLRSVRPSDCRDLWRWRNNLRVRRWCFDTRPISYESHKRWFAGKMHDAKANMFIAENHLLGKLGQVRFEKESGGLAGISINLNPDFLGRGLGSKIITLATGRFFSLEPGVKMVTAAVMRDNISSTKAFRRSGYEPSVSGSKRHKGSRLFRIKR